uniref:Uncharacterized protein n=1 Tax=Hucho hucho TaxID=62062 RepID=A0A4W5LLL0_9TELE
MAVLKWCSIFLTLFCQGTAASKPCRWTQSKLRSVKDKTIVLLSKMVSNLNSTSLLFGVHNLIAVFTKCLLNIFITFHKTELMHSAQFYIVSKVAGGVGASSGDGGSVTAGNASLKTYFDKLNTILKQKEHSACALEIVRKEVLENRVQFKKFIDRRVKP